jgi:hypothetical protein
MPSNISKARLTKAFDEGRRAAADKVGDNPYQNPKLRQLWEQGRTKQLAGELKTPIPPLEHGKARARTPMPGSPRPPARKPPFRPRDGFGNRPRDGNR